MRRFIQQNKTFLALCVNGALLLAIFCAITNRSAALLPLATPVLAQSVSPSMAPSMSPSASPTAALTPTAAVAPTAPPLAPVLPPGINFGDAVVMPGELSPNVWGCYLLDNQRQTLCVYEYLHNEGLKLVAARNIAYDRSLQNFNTSPAPADVKDLVEQPQQTARVLQSGSGKTP